jgi:hypothetical protein
VQTAGDLVVGGVELAAGVQLGEDDLDGGHPFAVGDHVVDRNAAAVIDDGDGVVDVDGDIDARGVSAERLVDRVVDDLVDQVVQAHLAGGADVHGRTQADRSQAFEHGDILGGVASALLRRRPAGRREWRSGPGCLQEFSFRADYGRCHSHSMRRMRRPQKTGTRNVGWKLARRVQKRRAKAVFSAKYRLLFTI